MYNENFKKLSISNSKMNFTPAKESRLSLDNPLKSSIYRYGL